MDNKEFTRKNIMRRVYIICTIRRLLSQTAFKIYVLTGAILGMLFFVSVGNVFTNMPALNNYYALYNFSIQAVMYTETTVQILLIVAAVVSAFLIQDIARNLSTAPRTA